MHVLLKIHQNGWFNFPREPISALRRIWRLSWGWRRAWIYFLSFGCAVGTVRWRWLPGKWTDQIRPLFYCLLIKFPRISHTFCLSPSFVLSRWHSPAACRLETGPAPSLCCGSSSLWLAPERLQARDRQPRLRQLQRGPEPVHITLFSCVPHRWSGRAHPRASPPQVSASQGHMLACDKWRTYWK